MNRNISNAMYGLLDYISYPIGMLLVAPAILHRLGTPEYGLWIIVTAIVSAGGIIASGFGDAGIHHVARLRRERALQPMENTVRSLFAIHLAIGTALMLAVWFAAPLVAHRFVGEHTLSLRHSVICLRLASIAIAIRAIETVPVCVQRAFEVYRGTVQISLVVRVLTLSGAAAVVAEGGNAVDVMVLTTVLMGLGTLLQFYQLRHFVNLRSIQPYPHSQQLHVLLRSGIFVWLQTLGSVVFRQFDRIAVGLFLGTAMVVPYAMSIQLSEPLFGLTASCLSFFFPYLSGRAEAFSPHELKRTVLKAFLCNALLVSAGAAFMFLCGPQLMRAWAGTAVEHAAHVILPLVVLGSALSGLSVVGTYAAQALGMFRVVALISLTSRGVIFLIALFLLQHRSLVGLATARVCYGAAALLVYLPLIRRLELLTSKQALHGELLFSAELREEAQL
jgi:O-antigen/teichoic acid export membrane protein